MPPTTEPSARTTATLRWRRSKTSRVMYSLGMLGSWRENMFFNASSLQGRACVSEDEIINRTIHECSAGSSSSEAWISRMAKLGVVPSTELRASLVLFMVPSSASLAFRRAAALQVAAARAGPVCCGKPGGLASD